jgi:polyphenol oxidase
MTRSEPHPGTPPPTSTVDVQRISETLRVTDVSGVSPGLSTLVRSDWEEAFPWLVQGTTTRGRDFRLWGPDTPAGAALEAWEVLRAGMGADTVVHARQVHGAGLRFHEGGSPGLHLVPPSDGHMTRTPGVLLAVSVADCVPVFLVAEARRAVAVLHAGWRGVAAGIVEAGIQGFRDRLGVEPGDLHLHLGPAISGPEYEVGPEVHRALGRRDPGAPAPLDLRDVVAERASRAGVLPARIGRSKRCTRTDPLLFSHRGGDRMRQVAYVMIRSRGT